MGFAIEDAPVEYSALPGRFATPLLGGAMAVSVGASALLAGSGSGGVALGLLVVSLLFVALIGRWLARHGVLALPVLRERGVNLVARRGAPTVWLVAHLDSKSQPVPIALRAAGLISLGVVWLAAAGLAIAAVAGAPVQPFGAPLAVASGIAGLPVLLSLVGTGSPGARDNASGVATVLCAVADLRVDTPLGVILTTAEELGLAGARALAASGGGSRTAINVDTVDDAGDISVMYTGRPPDGLVAALTAAGERRGRPVVVRRLVPGILTDGVAFADAGWRVVTVSKATMATLARVHTAADTPTGMTAVGITEAAALIADAVSVLHGNGG
jgi:hypothetical protein